VTPVSVTVKDETTAGRTLASLELQLEAERVTVRELIRARVHQEVRDYNAQTATNVFRGLVQPTDAEHELNGYRLRKARRIDPEEQTAAAISAFERGQILLLVDDRQVTELDDDVVLTPSSDVSFLKLVPLVGG
jgi:predicted oxidoreductase (fatty acid repression mutant protein)